jgi:hypothetical protein
MREWNPLLLAIYYGHLNIVQYFSEVLRVHLRTTLAMSKGGDNALLFALAVAIVKPETTHIFEYLWERYNFVWDYKCLKGALLMAINY